MAGNGVLYERRPGQFGADASAADRAERPEAGAEKSAERRHGRAADDGPGTAAPPPSRATDRHRGADS